MKFHIETLLALISLKMCEEDTQDVFVMFVDFQRDLLSHFREPPTLMNFIEF